VSNGACLKIGQLFRGRTGWVMRKVPLPESDSDHMHRCAMCAMLLSQPPDPRDDYSGDAGRFHPEKANLR
jgi:hypothetical protein